LHGAADHVFDRIAAAATDTDHLDLRALVELFDFDHFDTHRFLLSVAVAITEDCFDWVQRFRGGSVHRHRRFRGGPGDARESQSFVGCMVRSSPR
jgi:hypothetical protein